MIEYISKPDMPISVSALRDHCRVYDSSFDTQLTRAWYAAASDIEKRSGILLRSCQVRESRKGLSGLAGHRLEVGPVDYSSVVIKDASDVTITGWELDLNTQDATICVTDRAEIEVDGIYTIDYTAGFVQIPMDLMVAALELTAHHFENRESTTDRPLYAVPSSVWSIVQNYGRAKV